MPDSTIIKEFVADESAAAFEIIEAAAKMGFGVLLRTERCDEPEAHVNWLVTVIDSPFTTDADPAVKTLERDRQMRNGEVAPGGLLVCIDDMHVMTVDRG